MIHMLGSYSTRNNSKLLDKNISSARFFKKLSTTDENEKNVVNYIDRLIPQTQKHNGSAVALANLPISNGTLNLVKNFSNKKLPRKKSINNLTSMSGKALKTLDSIGSLSNLYKNSEIK